MIILDLVFDVFIAIYTSLGFGTKEYKIQTKMEKAGKRYPILLNIYQNNQELFETDDYLGNLVLNLNLKNEDATKEFVSTIQQYFNK
ncbi:hypothetical protein [Bacillus litorisediminis]|uniref:hypothetical protein n=1 Tax=Bacillus litorisediminis TaxID=2922713 RepID=UPI001FAE1336|nr:hypothetical protein [Bacillus litorisediminis]